MTSLSPSKAAPQNSAKSKPKKTRLIRRKVAVMSPEAIERIGQLEARLAKLEGRICELEQESVLNVRLKGPAITPEPCKWPIPTWPSNSDDAKCHVCGIRYKDMTHYVCNHPSCSSRVIIGDNPNYKPIVTWGGPGPTTTLSILGTATCDSTQPFHADEQHGPS